VVSASWCCIVFCDPACIVSVQATVMLSPYSC
jgi:hypothetical protein